MNSKYRYSIPKIKCKEDISSGFLIAEDKVITTVHSINEYLLDNKVPIEIIFLDKSGNEITSNATPILPQNGDIKNFEIIVLKLDKIINDLNKLECIKYPVEELNLERAITYGYPAVRQDKGTLIELNILGCVNNEYIDLKSYQDHIKDLQGCSGGPLIYKNYVIGVLIDQVFESGEQSRIGAVSLNKYENYLNEIGLELFERASDIYQFEEILMSSTEPKISLNFFNYEDKKFEDEFLKALKEQNIIYLQGKTKEEVLGYILYIVKSKVRHLIPKLKIVDGLVKWNELRNNCEHKILISNFNANEINAIPKNTNIILYGEEDFIGNKKTIKLRKRTLDNMRDKLHEEVGDLTKAHDMVRQCSGLYSIFKRQVFTGRSGKPKWEEHAGLNLLPALLANSWEDNTKDVSIINELTDKSYEEYIDSIKGITNGEDPFILNYNNGSKEIFKLANVEESWEILFPLITRNRLEEFKSLVLKVLTEVPKKYDLPVEKHYYSSLLTKEESEYSSTLKKGIIRSLIAIAIKESNNNEFENQGFVDGIFQELFSQIKEAKQWFAIAEFLPLIAEASPETFIKFIEKEVNNPKSNIWELFETEGDVLFGGNYYTHVLWALEKLLCLEFTVVKSILILVKLAERKLSYKISNSPLSTLSQALSAQFHEINVSLEDKIDLVERIVKDSSIGWELLKEILPNRSSHNVFFPMTCLNYRPYEIKYKLENTHQLFKIYKSYYLIAIKSANNDLKKWELLFDKCLFIELGLYDQVKENLIKALFNKSDEEKYILKEKIRDIIYRHRYFKDSDWTLIEDNVKKVEDLFKLITFENDIYNYLYLFLNNRLINLHPIPYSKDKKINWDKERQNLRRERSKALKQIIKESNKSLWDLVKLLKVYDQNGLSQQVIGQILASDIYNYKDNFEFLKEALENSAENLFKSYIETVYCKNGLKIIERVTEIFNKNDEIIITVLRIPRVDEKVLGLLDMCSEDLKQKYWEKFIIYWDNIDSKIKDKVWSKLLEYKNFEALLRMVDLYYKKDLEKNVLVLEEILYDSGNIFLNSQNVYLIIEIFKNIYRESNLHNEKELYSRICLLEWAYFSLLIDQLPPKYLKEELKTDPYLLATLIRYVYKSSKEEPNFNEKDKKLSKQAWNILFKLKFCPCVDQNNNISEDKLDKWVKKYLEEIENSGHEEIGRQILGECFSYSPKTNDDTYPHIAVCKVFEKYYSEDIGKGFIIGVLNSRGVYRGSKGEEEESLALKYKEYAKRIRVKFPNVSSDLLKISKHYKRQAFEERERASYDL